MTKQRALKQRDLSLQPETVSTKHEVCTNPFPCIADIFVLAGLNPACKSCEPNIQKMRDVHGYEKQGRFYISNNLHPDQQRRIKELIAQADIQNWTNPESDTRDTRTNVDLMNEEDDSEL